MSEQALSAAFQPVKFEPGEFAPFCGQCGDDVTSAWRSSPIETATLLPCGHRARLIQVQPSPQGDPVQQETVDRQARAARAARVAAIRCVS